MGTVQIPLVEITFSAPFLGKETLKIYLNTFKTVVSNYKKPCGQI